MPTITLSRSSLMKLFVILLGSSLAVAQAAPAPVTNAPKPEAVAKDNPWHIEYERLLHEDWGNLGHFRAANAALGAPSAEAPRVVLMGDSITDGWRGTAAAGSQSGEMGAFFVGKPYINRGIGGQTTPQMLVRFRQDVIDLHPAAVVILAGINDIAGNTGDTTLEAIENNFSSMCELSRLHGIRVVISSVLPAGEFPWKPGRHPAAKVVALNGWLREYAAANHYLYLDYYTPMATPTGTLRPELTVDGVHPNRAGYDVMAVLLQKAIDEALKP